MPRDLVQPYDEHNKIYFYRFVQIRDISVFLFLNTCMKIKTIIKTNLSRTAIFVGVILLTGLQAVAQDTVAVDAVDVFRKLILKKKTPAPVVTNKGSFAILPSVGYTPSTGFEFGADISGSEYLGNPESTSLSIFDAYGVLSTNELALIQLSHNIYTARNQYNLVGSWNLGKTVIQDDGIGTGQKNPVTLPLRYTFLKLSEMVYKSILDNFYAGAGVTFNYYKKITQENPAAGQSGVYNDMYSQQNGFDANENIAGGILLNMQYNSRDQPYRPYKGLYVDVILRTNTHWMGSQKSAMQLKTELRKYWSLSKRNPEHILAYWIWGSYLLRGQLPYLELPGTGSDTEQRTGRGYTIARFKGPSFFYNELEYRFPISANKLFSGVAFFNLQTASNQQRTKLFQYWEPGTGAGLRILFNKQSRSNLCIDYGIGKNGSRGVFVGLNEVF